MPLLFRKFAYSIYKRLRLFEILEFVFLSKMMPIYDFPSIKLGLQLRYLLNR